MESTHRNLINMMYQWKKAKKETKLLLTNKIYFLKRIIKNKKMVLTSVRIICRPAVRHGRRSVIVWDWCSASGLIYLAIINLCSLLWNCTEKLFQENVKAAVYDLKFVRVSVIQQNNGLKQINNNSKSCPSGQVSPDHKSAELQWHNWLQQTFQMFLRSCF